MKACDVEAAVVDLMPKLSAHLDQTLSPHVKARYAVSDIVHDTYVRAKSSLDSLQATDRAAIMRWLRRISHRLVIDFMRKKQTHTVNSAEASAVYAALTDSQQLTASRECSLNEAIAALQTALANLPDLHQLVIRLRYVEQLTFAEMAEQLQKTSGAVRGLHRNSLQGLQRALPGSSVYFLRRAR